MMDKDSLYSDEIWSRFSEKYGSTEEQFELKKYPQFDPYFNFFKRKEEIKNLVEDPSLCKVSKHSFIPFIKILTKTPRYRYQENDDSYLVETKIRPIAFASHFDTYLYGFYSFALTEKYQSYIKANGFSDCVLAYRTDLDGKCNIQFAKEVFDSIREKIKSNECCSAIALDISGYFDNIDHAILKEKWCKILNKEALPIDQYKVYRSLTKYNYVSKESILKHFNVNLKLFKKDGIKWQTLLDLIPDSVNGSTFNDKFNLLRDRKLIVTNLPKKAKDKKDKELQYRGIPQGSAMSAVLSNIYLIDFDKWLYTLSIELKFTYRRYCDDLIVVCETKYVKNINDQILKKIQEYNLTIQDKKTDLIEFTTNTAGKIRAFNKKKIEEEKAKLVASNEKKYYKNLQYLGFEFNGENIYIRPGSLSRYFRKMKGRIVKTVMMAYSKKSKKDTISKRQIYEKYSHFGSRNFISYALNSAKKSYSNAKGKSKEAMDSKSISRQISAHIRIIENEIIKTSEQRYERKKEINDAKEKQGKRTKHIPLKY